MPGLNQRGPMGQGPMTGRRMGRCTNFAAAQRNQNSTDSENQEKEQRPDYPERGFGLRWRIGGRGRGLGRQFRFRGGF